MKNYNKNGRFVLLKSGGKRPSSGNDDYILLQTDKRHLTFGELEGLTSKSVRIPRTFHLMHPTGIEGFAEYVVNEGVQIFDDAVLTTIPEPVLRFGSYWRSYSPVTAPELEEFASKYFDARDRQKQKSEKPKSA